MPEEVITDKSTIEAFKSLGLKTDNTPADPKLETTPALDASGNPIVVADPKKEAGAQPADKTEGAKSAVTDEQKQQLDFVNKFVLEKYPDLKLDKDLNLVDKDGKVVKTVDELDTEIGDINITPSKTILDEVRETIGVDLVDEQGVKIELPKDIEGVKSYLVQAVPQLQNQAIMEFVNRVPGLDKVVQHLVQGGTLDNMGSTIDYSTIEIKDKDTEQHTAIIAERYVRMGMEREEALKTAKALAAGGKSKEEATAAQEAIIRMDAKGKADAQVRDRQAKEERKQKLTEHYNTRFKLVDEGFKTELGQVKLPAAEATKFKDYISKPVDKQGNTAFDVAVSKLSAENEMLFAMQLFKNFNLKDLVTQGVRQERVTRLKELASSAAQDTIASGGTDKGTGKVNLANLDVSKMNRIG